MHLFSPQSLLVLTLYLSSTVHCLHKSRRDTSDLKTDSLLAKVLGDSDVKQERKDRSIDISQEPNTNAKWGQQAWSYFFGDKQNDKRAVNPAQEAMYNNRFQGVDRRSNIPTEDSSISQSADADSFPLHLNVHSPNARLKGAVPHFEEYGETVESVMKAQKRFKIPRPEEYSSEIVKKNDIPRPDDEDDEPVEPVVHHKKKRSKVAKKQYVQYPQQQQFAYNPYASNLMASGDLYAQQNAGMMQFQQPAAVAQPMATVPVANMAAATSHVQNLDGAIARPIVTEKVCDDQFALCNEYAKNNYCTDYEKQMRTQCRKSCNFCKSETPMTLSSAATSTSEDDVSGSGEFSGSGEQEPMRRNLKAAVTGSKRHDILQERAKIRVPDRDESGDGSGSGSADGSGSASGSGDADTDNGPIEIPIQQNPMQEFHIPSSRKDSFAGPPPQSDSDDGSGSASGSGDESGDSQDNDQQPQVVEAPKPKISKKSKIPRRPKIHQVSNNKRSRIPNRPAQPVFYPKIDLKAIASSLAHYEEAALELAGEYPKISDAEVTEYTRSFIPHPESDDEVRANRNRQNIQIAKIITAERARKSNIPQFLKVTGDVKKPEKDDSDAATLDSVQQRFIVPGVEPTLNDYYAETGKLNPFDKKGAKNYKKSRIEGYNANYDPYEYLRNMPAGASMEPIIDPHKRASIPSDHSYPVFLMKVSPTDEAKYVEEKAERRGEIRHFNAEGVEINNAKYQQMLHGGHPEMESAVRAQVAATRSKTPQAPAPRPQIPDFTIASKKATLPSFPAAPESAPAAYQQPSNPYENNFAQMQQNAMQQASLFPNNNQQFNYEQQPGPNNMRSKMFNAFFNVGTNSSPEEGSGSGAGEDFMSHMVPDHERLVSTPAVGSANSKVLNLQNLLQTSTPQETPQTERKDSIPQVMDTNSYLRSNLAELSPEIPQYNSYQYQPSLNAGTYGPQYSFNTMPKTQETSWMRPNAQSELASALTNQNTEARSNIQTQPTIQQQKKAEIPQKQDTQVETKSKVTLPTLQELFQEQQRQNEGAQHPKEAVAAVHSQQSQSAAMNYMLPETEASIHPLSLTTADVKKPALYDSVLVKKNLIKEKPDLNCGGEDWKGAEGDFGTFCYKNTNLKASFDDAVDHCKKLKGNMFSVLNAYENLYLQNHILSDSVDQQSWIGYHDKEKNGLWSWTDSSRSIYTNWGKEVDNKNNRHDCVYIDQEEGKWKDGNCTSSKPFLCKMKTESCPSEWNNLKLNSVVGCYKLFNDDTTWEKAEQRCKAENAHLASVASEDEQTMIYQFHSSTSYWIGFNDRENEGDWLWSDRLTSSYTNWADNAPNNGGYSCASVGKSGKWHDGKCNEKLNVVCKKKGPKPEKTDGYNEDGVLLPVSRLLENDETAPSHLYDDKDKSSPVVPLNFWPLLKDSKLGMAGNHPLAVNEPQNVKIIPGGVLLDGERSFLDAGDFHGHCIGDPEKCNKGFSVALQVKFDPVVLGYKKPHYVIDTSGRGRGFAIYIQNGKLHYKVVTDGGSWELETRLTVSLWQDIVLTWKNPSGLHVYVNGAFMDYTNITKTVDINTKMVTTTKLLIGRRSIDDRAPCTKMAVGSVVLFFKQLSVEDVPYAFTYGDTVVAYTRFFMTDIENSEIPGAAEFVEKSITNIDGGIFVDGDTSDSVKPHAYLQLEDFPDVIYNVQKARHGFAVSFKIKFDQRDRDYKEPRYILDTGGHNGGMKGISVYLVNDNMYFQVIRSSDEDIMIWKVRVPIYTIRWQEVVMTWRLDKGLWIYVDGMFRGHTLSPQPLPKDDLSTPKRLTIGRKNSGPEKSGAVFGFSSLAIFGRYLSRTDSEKVFGNTDNPYQGIIREVWKNTPGEELDKLEDNPDYPNNPTTIEIIENFDAPFNVESNYGSKLKGYFIAPETGNNTFYLSCSRACALYLSKDETGKTKQKILTLNKPTEHNVWNKYDNQSSEAIFLVAGKYYYLEAIQKGVDSSDSLSVGVKLPTGRYQRPINKENLQWRLPGNPHAGLVREVWYNIPGYSIEDLTSDSNFPNRPSSIEILDKFDAPFNYEDNYGSKVSGYFHAPSSGEYTFYMATDSSGELWLSSNENADSLKKIVTLSSWTDHNQWTKYPEQKSDKVFLVAGKYYYIRLYMKADKLGDCASVAVEMPDGTFEGPIKKKHLSWRLIGSNEGPGPKEVVEELPKPVGLYPLNENTLKDMITKNVELKNAEVTKGPGDLPKSAIELKGSQSSYLEIANNGKLDARKSITILTNIFPTGDNGPIVAYDPMGNGVHLWQYDKTQLFVRFTLRGSNGNMTLEPLATRVLQMKKWNQVGASYDNNTGVAQLWHDGKMVKSRNIGQVDLATDQNIRIGAVQNDKRYFEGKISCLQIYDIALREKEIGELRVCPKANLKDEKQDAKSAANNTHNAGVSKSSLPEALSSLDADVASGASEWFDEATEAGAETRIGDETEEELVATRCQPNPCSNEGVCQDDEKKIDGYVCMCPAEFTGRRCQVSKQRAENPVVKRTAIPTTTVTNDNTTTNLLNAITTNPTNASIAENVTKSDESKEDISLLYQKLGCYKDDPSNHDLKTKVDLKRTTQEDCAKACAMADKSYSYFGLQNGTSCFCGKDHGKYGKLGDEACNMTCNGNEAEKCGGSEANNVFFYGLGTNYTVKTFTGKPLGAGTDAKIYFELVGDRGSSDFRQLDPSPAKYEPGSEDIQTFLLPDLGKLKRMKILHDNTGTAPSWFLKKVQVTDEEGGSYEFPCDEWLSDTKGGGKLERELIAKSNIPTPS